VLPRDRKNRELAQRTTDLVFPPDVHARSVHPDSRDSISRAETGLCVKRRGQQQRQD
jgi:hypothetical protein